MKPFRDLEDFKAFTKWVRAVSGSEVLPTDSPEHLAALVNLYRNAEKDLLYLLQNPLTVRLDEWILLEGLDEQIPPLAENPKDPNWPDGTEQNAFIRQCHRRYCKEFEKSLIFRTTDLNKAIDDLHSNPALAPILSATKKALTSKGQD